MHDGVKLLHTDRSAKTLKPTTSEANDHDLCTVQCSAGKLWMEPPKHQKPKAFTWPANVSEQGPPQHLTSGEGSTVPAQDTLRRTGGFNVVLHHKVFSTLLVLQSRLSGLIDRNIGWVQTGSLRSRVGEAYLAQCFIQLPSTCYHNKVPGLTLL